MQSNMGVSIALALSTLPVIPTPRAGIHPLPKTWGILAPPTPTPPIYTTMNDRLTAEIERIRSDMTIPTLDEDNVKRVVIEPILKELGWNIYNTREFRSEYNLSGGKVDYALHLEDEPYVFLEAKNPREELGKHQRQLLEYAFEKGSPLAVLTNGLEWWLYMASASVDWEKRRFSVIDLRNPDVSQATDSLIDFLSRENVRSGYAVGYANHLLITLWEDKKIEEALPRAWNQLITDPDDQFLALLGQKVMELSGLGANQDQIKRFLANLPKPSPTTFPTPPQPGMLGLGAQYPRNRKSPSPVSFVFCGERVEVKTWSEILTKLGGIVYGRHSSEFDKVSTLGGWHSAGELSPTSSPKPISDSGWYVSTNSSRDRTKLMCDKLLAKFGYSHDDLQIETT